MNTLAQTNIQLFKQLEAAGYSYREIERAASAYQLASRLFSAQYRGSGKPFVSHLVGTASAVALDANTAEELCAALLHAAYEAGAFPFDTYREITARKRAYVASCIGEDAEQLVFAYHNTPWTPESLANFLTEPTSLPHHTVRLRLANELDDLCDDGMYFSGTGKAAPLASAQFRSDLRRAAAKVQAPTLRAALSDGLDRYEELMHQVAAPALVGRSFSYLQLPPCSTRTLSHRLGRALRRARRGLQKVRALAISEND